MMTDVKPKYTIMQAQIHKQVIMRILQTFLITFFGQDFSVYDVHKIKAPLSSEL